MSITLVIIVVTIAASLYAWNKPYIHDKWMMYPYVIKRNKEYFRFITSGFIHSGYVHLGFNMLSFYFFATYVEKTFNPFVFVTFYLMAIVVSDIPTFLKQINNPNYRSLGASGGVSAIIFSKILLDPLSGIGLVIIPGITISAFIFGIIYLIYSYYQAKNSSDNIGHEAHFYGAVFGIVFTIAYDWNILIGFFKKISTWTIF